MNQEVKNKSINVPKQPRSGFRSFSGNSNFKFIDGIDIYLYRISVTVFIESMRANCCNVDTISSKERGRDMMQCTNMNEKHVVFFHNLLFGT